ncbi:MarR family transcriptional regulator [Planosporangium thailandense]|uniref:MarR family transcriptional regulator n=1 Tax=Planosporangium thailandense TaxID=765197 RepID=A0ABX0XVT8_9ACTN|nr:MarR family transcriptional regulator [Planosporangium thailandense]NJC69941.1 MarR family transcriptional regulator [Planosporangium thailandense]
MDESKLIRLFTKTTKRMRDVAAHLLGPYDVRLGQNLLLEELWLTDGLTPGEAATRLGITGPTVVRMAQRMEETGLVTRRRDDRDGRLVRIYLTDRGRQLQEPIEVEFQQRDVRLLAGFSPQERAQLAGYLERILANLDSYDRDRQSTRDRAPDAQRPNRRMAAG